MKRTKGKRMEAAAPDIPQDVPRETSDNTGVTEIINDLITPPPTSRKCKYPTCNNEISAESQFPICEKCRSLAARNAVSLCIDPTSPKTTERFSPIISTLLTNLTSTEILSTAQRIEEILLEFRKTIKLHNLEAKPTTRPFKALDEQIDEAREIIESRSIRAKQERKREKKTVTRKQALAKLLGKSEKEVENFLKENWDL